MTVCTLLIANSKPPILVQPRQRALDNLTNLAKTTHMFSPALTEQRLDRPLPPTSR
jgi:hypothetical protein